MKLNKPIVLTLLGVIIFSVFLCKYFVDGCFWWDCAPERDFRVLDWELPSDLFPKGARLSPLAPSSEGAGEVERGSQIIYWNNYGRALYSIQRYPTIDDAIRQFEYHYKEGDEQKINLGWDLLYDLTYQSATVDDQLIVCIHEEEKSCDMISRYQEYVIRFYSIIDDDMTYSGFEKVLFYLDDQISIRLYP